MAGDHYAHLGQSDHQMASFLVLGEVRKRVTKTSTLREQSPRRLKSLQEGNPKDIEAGWPHAKRQSRGKEDQLNREFCQELGEKKQTYKLWKRREEDAKDIMRFCREKITRAKSQ